MGQVQRFCLCPSQWGVIERFEPGNKGISLIVQKISLAGVGDGRGGLDGQERKEASWQVTANKMPRGNGLSQGGSNEGEEG